MGSLFDSFKYEPGGSTTLAKTFSNRRGTLGTILGLRMTKSLVTVAMLLEKPMAAPALMRP